MYDNNNRGVLFKNEKKDTEKHPDYTGKINVDGKDMRLAAWITKSKDGTKTFMALRVSEYEQKDNEQYSPTTLPLPQNDDDPINLDDIPF